MRGDCTCGSGLPEPLITVCRSDRTEFKLLQCPGSHYPDWPNSSLGDTMIEEHGLHQKVYTNLRKRIIRSSKIYLGASRSPVVMAVLNKHVPCHDDWPV